MVAVRIAVLLVVALVACGAPSWAHPHPGDVVTDTLRGRVSEVDLEHRTVAVAMLDRKTKQPRNVLLFVDPKVKITQGKTKLSLMELPSGQAVICEVEVELNERGEQTRLIAFEIKFDMKARPALY